MMDGVSDRIASQSVTLDSTSRSTSSFSAVRSATEFVQAGFVSDGNGGATFYAPDAEALLDDAFIAGYCFRLVKADRLAYRRSRPRLRHAETCAGPHRHRWRPLGRHGDAAAAGPRVSLRRPRPATRRVAAQRMGVVPRDAERRRDHRSLVAAAARHPHRLCLQSWNARIRPPRCRRRAGDRRRGRADSMAVVATAVVTMERATGHAPRSSR